MNILWEWNPKLAWHAGHGPTYLLRIISDTSRWFVSYSDEAAAILVVWWHDLSSPVPLILAKHEALRSGEALPILVVPSNCMTQLKKLSPQNWNYLWFARLGSIKSFSGTGKITWLRHRCAWPLFVGEKNLKRWSMVVCTNNLQEQKTSAAMATTAIRILLKLEGKLAAISWSVTQTWCCSDSFRFVWSNQKWFL
jgi:hypothetical protein